MRPLLNLLVLSVNGDYIRTVFNPKRLTSIILCAREIYSTTLTNICTLPALKSLKLSNLYDISKLNLSKAINLLNVIIENCGIKG